MKNLFAIILIFLFSAATYADIVNVPGDQATIQAGIDAAVNGDTVLVADSTYYENISFMGKAITVASYFLIDGDTSYISKTIINGSQSADPENGSVVTFNSGEDTTSVLTGFTITGGTGSYYGHPWYDGQAGGGIWIHGGAKVTHNYIVNNSLQYSNRVALGGGICVQTGKATTPDVLPNGHVIVQNNRVEGNSCSGHSFIRGGGIAVLGNGTIQIADNIIRKNQVTAENTIEYLSGGGGLFIGDSKLQITRNIITENEAPDGAGLMAYADENQFFFSLQLINNTVAENHASGKGGGLYLFNGICNSMNNIIWGNTALIEDDGIFYRGNLNVNYSITQGLFPGEGNLQSDPLFIDNTFQLSDLSPAIDAANPETRFNDPADPENSGLPLFPAKGTLTADMGGYGGNDTVTLEPEAYPIIENLLYRQYDVMPYRLAYPLNYDSTVSYPLTIAMGGDTPNPDNEKPLYFGLPWRVNAEYFGYNEFTIITQYFPDVPWEADQLNILYNLIREVIDTYPIDTTRIVLSGHSYGGIVASHLPALYPNFFAAVIMSGGYWGNNPVHLKHVPLWAHNGEIDKWFPEGEFRNYISIIENTGLTAILTEEINDSEIQNAIDNNARLFYSEYAATGHLIQRYSCENYLMFEWLKKQSRPLIHPINTIVGNSYYHTNKDTIHFRTEFSNLYDFQKDHTLILENFDQQNFGNIELYDDGMHGDSLAMDGIWGSSISPLSTEDNFRFGIEVNNLDKEKNFYFNDLARFTTIGPVTLDSISAIRRSQSDNTRLTFDIYLKNMGTTGIAKNITAILYPDTSNPCFDRVRFSERTFGDISPGESKRGLNFSIYMEEACSGDTIFTIPFSLEISSDDYVFWSDQSEVVTAIEEMMETKPLTFKLEQNYPNPFNPTTNIEYTVRAHRNVPQHVELSIYNLLGQKVATLVNKKQTAGTYNVKWDASGFGSGVYLYTLETGNGYKQTKKLVFLK